MWNVRFMVFIVGLYVGCVSCQYLNNRPFPTYSLENMPDTGFTCRDKILGGYYADSETQCQMFHICVKVAGVGVQDFRFLCPNSTAFDQDHQICADWEDVDCDATTLYYASDNFDLYRIGSGFESKAVKYGEEEETFSLQRAETGDARLNREHQTQRVNQQKDLNRNLQAQNRNFNSNNNHKNNNNHNNNNNKNNNNDREIFRGSSSSNFFNNRNGGKEIEDDDDDDQNVNANQHRDFENRRKVVRKQQQRRPQNNNNYDAQTQRPNKQITNNFAGSSYIPTTTRTTAIQNNNEQQQQQQHNNNNHGRGRSQSRQRVHNDRQYNNADEFRQQNGKHNENSNKPTPAYTVSTPAPFKQTQQYNKPASNNDGNKPTTPAPKQANSRQFENYPSTQQQTKQTENYPSSFPQVNKQPTTPAKQNENYPTTAALNKNTQYNNDYEVSKVKQAKQTENYPSTFETKKATTPFKQTENYPTPFNTNTKSTQVNTQKTDNYPTTFAPRTNAAYTQISQQTSQLNTKQTQKHNTNSQSSTQYNNNNNPTVIVNNNNNKQNTNSQRTSPFTQYTPTVPKITTPYYSSTTPVSRPNKFDETQYDDGSYNSKYNNYDNKGHDDEFLKTAHSTNIANSRNEYSQSTKNFVSSTQKPRPFAVSANTPKPSESARTTQNFKTTQTIKTTEQIKTTQTQQLKTTANVKAQTQNTRTTHANNNNNNNHNNQHKGEKKKSQHNTPGKNEKNASYDYAYYDTNVGSEPEYDIDAEFGKTQKLNKKQ